MGLSGDKKFLIKELLKQSIRLKFQNYNPETQNMPFHYRLLGKDRMYLFSFIQSLNTTFGMSIYEPAAIELAKGRFKVAKTQVKTHNKISDKSQGAIQTIIDGLTSATSEPNKDKELEIIRKECGNGRTIEVKKTKVDIWLEKYDGELFLLDMKTVKPNKGEFVGYKRMLLEWAAVEMTHNPSVKVNTIIAIPYNPYEPKPYERWTMKGLFDLEKEIYVANELWDFLGGDGAYNDLLDCFELAGIELRPEIDSYFARFK